MSRGDRTGPLGQGPRTGRAAGYCTGRDMTGYMNPTPTACFGRGLVRGFGRGRRGGFYTAPPSVESQQPDIAAPGSTRTALKTRLGELEAQLAALREQIDTMAT